MAGETELTFDIYGQIPLTPRTNVITTGVDITTTTNGAAQTGNGRIKNGFLPSGMSRGGSRNDGQGVKQQLSKKIAPVLRRFTGKQGYEIVNDETTYTAHQSPTATGSNHAAAAAPAGLNKQRQVGERETPTDLRRSEPGQTPSNEQQHLQVILGAPAGFRDSSFDESDEAPRTATADGNLRSSRVSMNADGSSASPPQGITLSFTDVKKRSSAFAHRPLPPPPLVVKNFNSPRRRLAAEVPASSRTLQSTETSLPGTLQSSANERQTKVDDKQPAQVGEVVSPRVFIRHSQTQPSNTSSSAPEVESSSSVFHRSSFIRHLETVVARQTPTSSAVSTMTRDPERPGHEVPEDLDQSSSSLVSRLFQSALSNHEDEAASSKKKFKFLVPGIDVPTESTEPADVDVEETAPQTRVRRGFSYLTNVEVAAEVTRRAASVTARRPHQSVEEAKTQRDQVATDRDEEALRAARARLHAPKPRFHLPAAAQTAADSGGRQQMLLEVVAAARRRARKTGTDADDYIQEDAATVENSNYRNEPGHGLLRAAHDSGDKLLQRETSSSSAYPSGTSRGERDSKHVTSVGNRLDTTSQNPVVFDSGRVSGVDASGHYDVPAALTVGSDNAHQRVDESFTSYRAARHAHCTDIDRQQLNAVDDAANAASVRGTSDYLSYMSAAAPVVNGIETRYGSSVDNLEPYYYDNRRLTLNVGSSEEDLDSHDELADGYGDGYTVSIAGGQVRARRSHGRRSKHHRRRSLLRRRPHVRQGPVSVEVWSSGEDSEPDRPYRSVVNRGASPLTVNTDNFARPHSVIGHVRYPGVVTQSVEIGHPQATGGSNYYVPPAETSQYFSDPETRLGPYRTSAYVSQSGEYFNSPASYRIVTPEFETPEFDTMIPGKRTSLAVPIATGSVMQPEQQRVEPLAGVDPHLADVGTKNRRYFVEMRLNAARGGGEVTAVGRSSSNNSAAGSNGGGGGGGGGLAMASWHGSAPQLLQLADDVIDQYTGARYDGPGRTSFGAMESTGLHRTVYDVTTGSDPGAPLFVSRPQSTPPWIDIGDKTAAASGHVVRSVTSARSPQATAVSVAASDRRRPASSPNGDVNRSSTVEFDIKLEPDHQQRFEMDELRRNALLSSVQTNGLASQPQYTIQLNDTMRVDVVGSRPSPPTYDRVYQRQQRRRRPQEQAGNHDRQRTVVDVQSSRPSRRRRQIQVNHDDDPSRHIDIDDVGVIRENEVFDAYRSATDRQPSDAGDLPHVVRGSILIRNSLDTAGTPRHVDVVTLDSDGASDTAFVVEDNTNMFDGLYRQSRENPIYLSDPEMSPDEVDGPAVSSRTFVSRRPQRSRRQGNSSKKTSSIADDFNRSVKISRGT